MKEALLKKFDKAALEGASGKFGKCNRNEQDHPSIEDIEAFGTFVAKNKAYDLFQKRINKEAWRARQEAGEKVPGVTIFRRVELRITKRA